MYEHFEWNRDKIKILLENVIEKIVKYNKKEVFMSNLGDVGSWTQIIYWVLDFGRERGALAESVRSPSPRRNISSNKLNADRV